MASSRSGAGGKIVTNRRKQRLAATPYDRPPPQPVPPKSPNWFTGKIVPSARAIVSGAGKIFSSIFTESESSSSEDEDSASENGDSHCGNLYDGVSKLDKENMTSSEMMHYGHEPRLTTRRAETKRLIEQLIMQETFSREECDNLIQVLNSRVIGCSTEEKEKSLLDGLTGNAEDPDIFNKAVEEAKKWFQEKKVGSSSATELAHGTSKLRSNVLEQVDSGGGSPVDVARSYMKDRPPWASPTRNFELRTPLTSTNLLNEGKLYSAGADSLSSSKKRNSLASGSWNIQEELRRVRSKATDDMLRTPSSKIDPSLFAVRQSKEEPVGAAKLVFTPGEQMIEPESLRKTINEVFDTGVSHGPALPALGSGQDGKASEALSSRPADSLYGNNEDPETVQTDGEHVASKSPHSLSPSHTEEHHTDSHLNKTNGSPTAKVTESAVKVNGHSSLPASMPAGTDTSGPHTQQNYENHDMENHNSDSIDENKSIDTNQVEAYTEIPIVTETDSISQNNLHKSPPVSPQKEKVSNVMTRGRKSGKQRKLRKR